MKKTPGSWEIVGGRSGVLSLLHGGRTRVNQEHLCETIKGKRVISHWDSGGLFVKAADVTLLLHNQKRESIQNDEPGASQVATINEFSCLSL